MSRPKTKEELIQLSQANYKKLLDFIDGFSKADQQKDFHPGTMNRNIRDVIAHLHHWHLMMKKWYDVGMSGKKPEMPAKGYTWKTTPALNKWIWENYRSMDLKTARMAFEKSYQTMQEIIDRHSNDELFTKKRYKWTGSTSLGAYLVSATSSHYDWAYKLIKKGLK